ncbi:MAG: dihydrolipoamide acetyltransferase family protein [Spirochaetota bacterium]
MLLEIKVPEAGFSVTEGTVIEWFKNQGDQVREGETLVSIETEKLSVDIPAERSGVLEEIRHGAGETVPVGGVLGVIRMEQEARAAAAPPPEPELSELLEPAPERESTAVPRAPEPGREGGPGRVSRTAGAGKRISPLAKAVARDHGLDLAGVHRGSGPHGRIVKQDVLRLLDRGAGPSARRQAPGTPGDGETREVPGARLPYTGWRKVIADKMTASFREVPHYTMSVEIDMTDAAALIAQAREDAGRPRITYLHLVMKALVTGIDLVPQVNAFCFTDGYELREEVNIGIAVDLGEKLLVPVVRRVGEKNLLEIAEETGRLVRKAREDRLEPRDVEGGTITLTNVGVYNIHSGTSIIMQPQSSILYLGVVREVPAVWEGSISVRRKMMLGATFDHRLVHGGPGARFLDQVKASLENLNQLLLRLR